jgi:hypothetical protein
METQGLHGRRDEAVPQIQAASTEVVAIGEQRDARQAVAASPIDGASQEARAQALAALVGQNDEIFEPRRFAALGGADRKEQAHHAEDLRTARKNEQPAEGWLRQQEVDGPSLFGCRGGKVGLLLEEVAEELDHRVGVRFTGLPHTQKFLSAGLASCASLPFRYFFHGFHLL